MNLVNQIIAGIWFMFAPVEMPKIYYEHVLWIEIRHTDTFSNNGEPNSEIILHDGPCRDQRVTSFPHSWCVSLRKGNRGEVILVWRDFYGDVRITQALSSIETWEPEPNYTEDDPYFIQEGFSDRRLLEKE